MAQAIVEQLQPSQVLAVITKLNGNRTKAAKSLGISRGALITFEKHFPEITEAVQQAREEIADVAEDKLREKVEQNYWPAVRYALDNIGRNRGYGSMGLLEVNDDSGRAKLTLDLADPEVRRRALALTDSLVGATSNDGPYIDSGEVGNSPTPEIIEP